MRHQRAGKKLGRDSAHRKALYSNLAGALIEHGRIQTTEAKAKAVKPFAEKMITLGKRGDLARAQAGARRASLAGRRPPALRRRRAALRRAARRLHADRQARPAPGRRRGDGLPRARRLRAGRLARVTAGPASRPSRLARWRSSSRSCSPSSCSPPPWGVAAVGAARAVELAESALLIRWSRRRRSDGRCRDARRRARRSSSTAPTSASAESSGAPRDLEGREPGESVTGAGRRRARAGRRMKLRLTLEYDGTAFRGWARQPGERTVEGVLREALDAVFPTLGGARGRRADRRGRPRDRTGREPRRRGRAAARAGGRGAQRRAAGRRRRAVRRRGRGTDFHARFSARARSYRYRVLRPPARARRSSARRALWWPRPLDEDALAESARCSSASTTSARSRRRETQHEVFLRIVRRAALGAARRRARLHDHGRQLPAAHGADARRDDARARARGDRAAARRAARAPRPGRRRRRGASTSST